MWPQVGYRAVGKKRSRCLSHFCCPWLHHWLQNSLEHWTIRLKVKQFKEWDLCSCQREQSDSLWMACNPVLYQHGLYLHLINQRNFPPATPWTNYISARCNHKTVINWKIQAAILWMPSFQGRLLTVSASMFSSSDRVGGGWTVGLIKSLTFITSSF